MGKPVASLNSDPITEFNYQMLLAGWFSFVWLSSIKGDTDHVEYQRLSTRGRQLTNFWV